MHKILLLFVFFQLSHSAYADWSAYNGIVTDSIESANYLIIHHHECISFSVERIKELGQDVKSNPYLENEEWYSYIKLVNKQTKKTIFKVASPILKNLIIDELNELILGFSNIKFNNPYSLIIFNFFGKPIIGSELNMFEPAFPIRESVTNYRGWYNEENVNNSARIIIKNNRLAELRFEGIDEKNHTLKFTDEDFFDGEIDIIDYSNLNNEFDVYEEYFNEKENTKGEEDNSFENKKMILHLSIFFLTITLSVLLFRKKFG